MPRNFSEVKSGGDNSYVVPPTLKSVGGTRPPPRPPPIDARAHINYLFLQGHVRVIRPSSVNTDLCGLYHKRPLVLNDRFPRHGSVQIKINPQRTTT